MFGFYSLISYTLIPLADMSDVAGRVTVDGRVAKEEVLLPGGGGGR